MKSVNLVGKNFVLRDVPRPVPAPGQLLVRTVGCGVCMGDVSMFLNRRDDQPERTVGHEGSGIVEAVGTGVEIFAAGDAVTVLGGTYSEYFVCPADHAIKLPAQVSSRIALGEPVACCVHAWERQPARAGEKVAVIGCGFMGLVCLRLAALAGVRELIAIDPVAERREMALRFGATAAYDAATPVADLVARHGQMHLVIEAVGTRKPLTPARHWWLSMVVSTWSAII